MVKQLDFLGCYSVPKQEFQHEQFLFWDDNFNPIKPKQIPSYKKVEEYFKDNLDTKKISDYTGYWEYITPKTESEIFQRWLFSLMSVHTSWQSNVIGYNAIKDWTAWFNNPSELSRRITEAKVGLQNNRTKYISEFAKAYWQNPEEYIKKPTESWTEYRDRVMHATLGLGKAKTSFAIELCYPTEAKVVCMDTHMFQAYGLDQSIHAKQYEKIEEHWIEMSAMWNIPAYIARCMLWDNNQGKIDSRYWSYVLEKDDLYKI